MPANVDQFDTWTNAVPGRDCLHVGKRFGKDGQGGPYTTVVSKPQYTIYKYRTRPGVKHNRHVGIMGRLEPFTRMASVLIPPKSKKRKTQVES